METQRQEFRIGVMVLAALVSLILMTVFFGRQPMMHFGDDNLVQVRFQRSPGIKRNSPVFKNGVQVGRVVKVELVDQDREVEVTLSLDKRRKIYTNEECRIRQTVIMGDASLEFVKRNNFAGKIEEIDPAIPLVGVGSSDLMGGFTNIEGDLTKAIQNVSDAANHLGGFVDRLNSAVGTPEEFKSHQEKFTAIIDETRQAMNSMRYMTDGINKFVNDPKIQADVRKVIADLPEVIERSRNLVGESTLFVKDARTLIDKGTGSLDLLTTGLDKVSNTLENVMKITDQIEGDVPEIVTAVKKSAVRLESLFSELTMIVTNFRNADGTVKRLIRDPAVYEKLLATLGNVEQITDEVDTMLRVDMKPIANNVKILTDKAARDPAVFIRNLLRKEPPIKRTLPYWGDGLGSDVMCGINHQPDIIYEEAVEVSEAKPITVNRVPALQLPKFNRQQRQQPVPAYIESVEYETVPEQGRIVNVDPRYAGN